MYVYHLFVSLLYYVTTHAIPHGCVPIDSKMTLRPVSGPQFCPAGSVSVRAVVRDLNLGSIPISPSSGAEVTNFTREAQQESEGTGNDDFANAGKPLQISSNGHRVITGINTNNSTGNCTGKRHYRASVTHYGPCGQPDGRACGFLPVNGFTAAASAQLYASPGKGQIGHACGSCWLVHGKTDSSGRPSNTNDIVVQVRSFLCPW